jgi:peptide/nickel transport system substrate-binding protein
MRGGLVTLMAAALVVLTTSACRQAGQAVPSDAQDSRLRIGVGGASTGNDGMRSLAQILAVESLARLSDDGRPQPWLARDWQLSQDHRGLTVNLLPHVKFHDGTPLTATIVANALKSSLPTFMGATFEDLESVEATSPLQVVIRLRKPSPFLMDTLETSIMKPGSPLVGTGPFVVEDTKSPREMHANADYPLGAPSVKRISVQAFPSVRAAWADMLRGRIDMLYEVEPDALDSLQASNNIAIFSFVKRYQLIVVLNTNAPVFRSKAIRQALNEAIDRKGVVRDALGGHGVASSGPVWPRNYAFRGDVAVAKYDVAAAAKTLKSEASGSPVARLRFTCLVPTDAVPQRVALVVKRQLAAVGVDMNVEEVGVEHIADAMKNHQFDAVLTEMISGPSMLRLYRMWHSGGVAGATSASIDAALDRVRYSGSDDEYRDSVTAFQKAVADDPPAIFLAWMERARAVSKRFAVPATEPGRDVVSSLRLWKPVGPAESASRN